MSADEPIRTDHVLIPVLSNMAFHYSNGEHALSELHAEVARLGKELQNVREALACPILPAVRLTIVELTLGYAQERCCDLERVLHAAMVIAAGQGDPLLISSH